MAPFCFYTIIWTLPEVFLLVTQWLIQEHQLSAENLRSNKRNDETTVSIVVTNQAKDILRATHYRRTRSPFGERVHLILQK